MAGRSGFVAGACAAMLTCGALGCSGATETGLFSGDDGPAPPHASSPDAAAHPSSPSSLDAGGGGNATHDASIPDPTADASPTTLDASIPDTAPPDDNPGIQCGTSYCHPGTDVCCRIDAALSPTFLCLPPQGCSSVGALAIACDDADDCAAAGEAGDVCCVTEDAQTGRASMQAAFRECHGLQCGFCTPGMVMASVQLLADNPKATEDDIRCGLDGNLCRCTGYHNIVRAVQACQSGQVGSTTV